MAAILLISIVWTNFKLLTPSPKVWVSGFPSVDGTFQHLCMATLKTFMHGHLCVVYESPMCSFTLPDICIVLQMKEKYSEIDSENDAQLVSGLKVAFTIHPLFSQSL